MYIEDFEKEDDWCFVAEIKAIIELKHNPEKLILNFRR